MATPSDPADLKRLAAHRALDFVENGMKLGLGTGSTAEAFLELLAEKVHAGLSVVGTPTSRRTADKARALNVPTDDLDALGHLDLVVDGADEADNALNLIKGGGGALLREKIVAASASRMVVIADDSKLVPRLGAFALPVEVVPFGHVTTARRITAVARARGYDKMVPVLRMKDDAPYRTDNGNYIYDCPFGAIGNAALLSVTLSSVPGVVEHGLFVEMATALVIAGPNGVKVIERPSP